MNTTYMNMTDDMGAWDNATAAHVHNHATDHQDDLVGETQTLSANPFCNSVNLLLHGGSGEGGLIMYMQGFRFSLSGGQPCLNLYFPGWTLDTRGKFVGAFLGILVLAMCVEGFSKLRHTVVKASKQGKRSGGVQGKVWNSHLLRLTVTVMHGTQALIGYFLMLAVMTFSVELLFAVIFGLSFGFASFFRDTDEISNAHVTTNPCCAFMEEEVKDLQNSTMSEGEEVATVPNTGQDSIDERHDV